MDLKKLCNNSLRALLLTTLSVSATAHIEILDRVVAVVDQDVVLQSEVQRRVETINMQIQNSGTQAPPEEILNSRYSSA